MNLRDVTVIVTTCNAASHIATCLDKLSDFGEIVLVDSFSADDTQRAGRRDFGLPPRGGKRSG